MASLRLRPSTLIQQPQRDGSARSTESFFYLTFSAKFEYGMKKTKALQSNFGHVLLALCLWNACAMERCVVGLKFIIAFCTGRLIFFLTQHNNCRFEMTRSSVVKSNMLSSRLATVGEGIGQLAR